jgi:hypothetical protein
MKITKIKSCLLVIGFIFMLIVLLFDIINTDMHHDGQRDYFRPRMNEINLKKTALAIFTYTAEDKDSRFPPDLKILEDKHIAKNPEVLVWLDPKVFQYPSFLTLFKYKAPRAKYFLYFPPKEEFDDDMDLSRIILAEPYPNNGERQYLTLKELTENGRPPKLPEAEFRKRAKEQGLKLPD